VSRANADLGNSGQPTVVARTHPPGLITCGPCVAHLALVGFFVPKPSREADCQGCGLPDLAGTVHWRPLVSVADDSDSYSPLDLRSLADRNRITPAG
jgi:hypothetical protein